MKKYILLVAVVCGLTACSTDPQKVTGAVETMGFFSCLAMGGKHCGDEKLDDYVRTNGVPTSSYKMSNGDTLYSFIKTCPSDNGQEEITLTVDKDGWITQKKTVRACPANTAK